MKKLKILIISMFSILLTFILVQYFVNGYIQDYKIEIALDNPNYEKINEKEYWEYIITSKEYDVKYGLSSDLFDTMIIEDGYLIIDGKWLSYDDANRLLRTLLNDGISTEDESYTLNYSTIIINRTSPVITLYVVIIEVIILLVYVLMTKENRPQFLTLDYWKSSKGEIKNIRKLCLMSIIFACQIASKFITLPSGFGDLSIGIGYLFQAVNCLLFGPVNGLILGAVGDIIGFIIKPTSTFFPGYTLNAMLSCFMYGLCFYKTKVTFTKVLISRMFINIVVNVLLGSLWMGIVAGLTYTQSLNYMLFMSLPKNIFYLIPQSLLLYFTLKYTVKIFYRNNYIEEYQTHITIF